VCHGAGGVGDGMLGVLFEQEPKTLTLLTKKNNGTFPFGDVCQPVDGMREIAGHGRSEVPVREECFIEEAIDNPAINPKNARLLTQGRILAVVYYLQPLRQ